MGNGFVFEQYNTDQYLLAIKRSLTVFEKKGKYKIQATIIDIMLSEI